jgi:threonine dehydrogenase-like Zn-dependent dehydrogenase
MNKKYIKYASGTGVLPEKNTTWPLYGSGLEHLGKGGKPVEQLLDEPASDELLIRHDAVGLCFTDVKEIKFGDQHPRLTGRGLSTNPIIPGHEASMTVVAVGNALKDQYKVGDRFVIQPDVWYKGKSIPYSFGMDGAYRQYALLGEEILNGDEGCYLIPVPQGMSYAGAALTEPWACVEAAYHTSYRTEIKENGKLWIFGNKISRSGYYFEKILNVTCKPKRVVITEVPGDLVRKLKKLSLELSFSLEEINRDRFMHSEDTFDDIIILDGDANEVDQAAAKLANNGIIVIAREKPMSRPVQMDIGRIHYDHIVYVGTTGRNLDEGYQATLIRSEIKPNGRVLVMGAGGPMGRMHLQRAIESSGKPSFIFVTDIDDQRLQDLVYSFHPLIDKNPITLEVGNPISEARKYGEIMNRVMSSGGFDDVEVMVTNIDAIVETSQFIGERGSMNLFAGLKRGTMASIDAWLIYGPRQARIIGHSGSKLSDQVMIVDRFKHGELEPHRSMAALCGMNQIPEGVNAMMNSAFPGKIIVYPMVPDFQLTGLSELKTVLPEVYEKLENGRTWTMEAEALFLDMMLPENRP